jgi:small subunit ribosomal protein S15
MAKKAEEKAEKKPKNDEEKPKAAEKAKEEKASNKAAEKKEKAKEKAKEEKPAQKPGKEDKKTEHKAETHHKKEGPREGKDAEEGHAGKERHKPKKQKPKRGKASKEKFVEFKPAEAIEAIVHLANEGHSASEIGMILRDQYGVPKIGKHTGKKLAEILQEHKLLPQIPEDLMNLIRRSVVLREHLAKNKKDMSAKRGLMLTVSKIRALERYYKQAGKLPLQWRYSPEIAALLAK